MTTKRILTASVLALALAGFARAQDGHVSYINADKIDAQVIKSDVVAADQVLLPHSVMTLVTNYVYSAPAHTNTSITAGTNGWTTNVTITGGSSITFSNVVPAARIAGECGVYVKSSVTGATLYMPAPGTLVYRSRIGYTNVSYTAGTNGWITTTNAVAGFTNSYPAASIGATFAIVAAGNFTVNPGSTFTATNTYSMVTNSVLLMTPVSASQWKVITYAP